MEDTPNFDRQDLAFQRLSRLVDEPGDLSIADIWDGEHDQAFITDIQIALSFMQSSAVRIVTGVNRVGQR